MGRLLCPRAWILALPVLIVTAAPEEGLPSQRWRSAPHEWEEAPAYCDEEVRRAAAVERRETGSETQEEDAGASDDEEARRLAATAEGNESAAERNKSGNETPTTSPATSPTTSPTTSSTTSPTSLVLVQDRSNCTDPDMPLYSIYPGPPADERGFFQFPEICNEGMGRGFANQLTIHPCRTENLEEADLMFICCYTHVDRAVALRKLPLRNPKRPYVIFAAMHMAKADFHNKWHRSLVDRPDMVFLALDRRDPFLELNEHEPLPGVTIASPLFFRFFDSNHMLESPPRFFLTFKGSPNAAHTTVRHDLRKTFAEYHNSSRARTDVQVCVFPNCTQDLADYTPMMDTAYALCPRGHGRWSYRLSEIIGACAIPVIMADGLTLPFEALINWTEISIRLPEKLARQGAEAVIDSLPQDWETIRRMRERVCEVNKLYFETETKRLEGAVKSVKQYLQDLGGERRPVKRQ